MSSVSAIIFLVILFLSFLVFVVRGSLKYYFALAMLTSGIILTSVWCAELLTGSVDLLRIPLIMPAGGHAIILTVDRLSAFFIIVINFTVLIGFLYARGYLAPYYHSKSPLSFSIHYFSYLWLWLSMLMVVMIRDGVSFLIVWEIMALSLFFLVIFDAEERTILKTGINYLIQMHAGMFMILIAFLVVEKATGRMSLDALGQYFSSHATCLFSCFSLRALPLKQVSSLSIHAARGTSGSAVACLRGDVWCDDQDGYLRDRESARADAVRPPCDGIIILVISLISGVLGVMMAIVQHDLKRLLAYHSIENIGIIGTGIGLGMIGLSLKQPGSCLAWFCRRPVACPQPFAVQIPALLQRRICLPGCSYTEHGTSWRLMKRMPYTAILFLIGSLAICGLPPFNGFISEYLIYMGCSTLFPEPHSILQ